MGPDWKRFYTPEEAKAQLGFQFEGIGWYETEADTLLVLDQIEEGHPNAGRYEFWCWNTSGARQRWSEWVSKITHMPVRQKEAL